MSQVSETVLEINLKALGENYQYLRSKLQPATQFMAVIKAFGYGSDGVVLAKELETYGVDYFAVAYVNEGVALRDAGINTPILVLHPQATNFKTLIDRCLEPSLYNAKVFREFVKIASEKGQNNYPVHIKFNTGLNRLGFWENDVDFILSEMSKTKTIQIKSIFSHLAASEDLSEATFNQQQISSFKKLSSSLCESLDQRPMLHMCNTSGILNYPEAHFDMVRSGIGLYGFGNSEKEDLNFRPIARLKTIISQIHMIEKGETVGYNRAFKSDTFLKTATLPIGHADGISRAYGNGIGWVTIHGKKAPIIGNVCMDMIMVNATGIDCQEGDEVLIFGEETTAEELTNAIHSISYELITAISQRIKRVVCRK